MGLLPAKPVDLDLISDGVRLILEGLGQQHKTEVMENTPRRVAELYAEMINPTNVDADDDPKTFGVPDRFVGTIYVTDVHYVSMCEHHLMPAFGVAHVAYIPDQKVVGYSKLKKALNYVARQPQLNERIVADVLGYIVDTLDPVGAAVSLQSTHCCIATRTNGPAQEIVTIDAFYGTFDSTSALRDDFRAKCNARKPLFLGQ